MAISSASLCLGLITALAQVSLAQSGPVRPRQVSPGSSQTQNQGESTIRGRAIFSDSGEPVAKARVTLTSRGQGRLRTTSTDDRGEFHFERVAAGDYQVVVHARNDLLPNAAAFPVPLPSGDPATDEANFEKMSGNASRVSVDGTGSVYVEVRVARKSGGNVSGRVTYANGKPALRSRVSFISKGESGSPATARYSVEVNDKGVYLLKGLPPGEYIVSASQPPDPRQPVGSSADSIAPTYFPSAIDPGSATPVTVFADHETADINIILLERSLHKIAGTVKLRRSGQPLAGVMLRLVNKDDTGQTFGGPITTGIEGGSGAILMAGRTSSTSNTVGLGRVGGFGNLASTDAQGRWSFSNIPDGEYTLVVGSNVMGITRAAAGGPVLRSPRGADRLPEKHQPVTVAGSDIKDLSIEISQGGTVSGVVEVEGGMMLPPRVLVTSQVSLEERRPAAFAEVASDGTFTMNGVPEGEVFLGALVRPVNAFYVRSVEANGAELPQGQLRVEDGEEIRGVRIVLSPDVAGLTGRVLASPGGAPVGGAVVMLVPVDREGRALPHATLIAPTLGDGRFMIGGPPGEYFAVVLRLSDGPPPRDLESIKALTNGAPRVTLRSGERQSMDLIAPAK